MDFSLHTVLIGDVAIAAVAFGFGIFVGYNYTSEVAEVVNVADDVSSDAKHIAAAITAATSTVVSDAKKTVTDVASAVAATATPAVPAVATTATVAAAAVASAAANAPA